MKHSQWGPVPGCHLKVHCVSPRQLEWMSPAPCKGHGRSCPPSAPLYDVKRPSGSRFSGPPRATEWARASHVKVPSTGPVATALPQSQLPEAATRPLTPLDTSTTLRPPLHPHPRVQAQRFSHSQSEASDLLNAAGFLIPKPFPQTKRIVSICVSTSTYPSSVLG